MAIFDDRILMKREYGLEQIRKDPRSVVTVGTFDGIHIGHRAIVRYLVERAQQQDARSVVVSFDPHPREVLSGQAIDLLTTISERAQLLEGLGVDRFIMVPFDREFAALPPEAFVEDILVERIGLHEIVVGYDHGFGKGRQGDSTLLRTLGTRHGFSVDLIPAQVVEEQVVSSTMIRRMLIDTGDVGEAAVLLGRRYTFTGIVVPGAKRGRTIGYPTANLELDHERKVVPKRGVYAVQACLEADGQIHAGMMNIGYRPTFDGETKVHLEVHLFDFDQAIYGQKLHVTFVDRLRDERKFEGINALIEQLAQDEKRSRAILEAI